MTPGPEGSNTRRPQVVVIGAGLGGLSAAIGLAAKGWRVTVVEQLDRPGGKMGEVRADGFRWDTGPSVITMRPVIEQLFRDAGRDLNDYVDLQQIQPITRYFWRDGTVLDAVTDQDEMAASIERVFGRREADAYRRFMRYVARLHGIIGEPFLYRAKPRARDLVQMPLADVFRIDALRTMNQAIRSYFRAPHLNQLFGRFATYNGSSPYDAPATLNVIAHVEMAEGAWYPRGGVFKLAQAYERLAAELGVDLRYSCRAEEITVEADRATGVRLAQGAHLRADAVINNVDYTHAQATLIPKAQRTAGRELEPSCSGFILLLGAVGRHEKLAHHNILFTNNYPAEFDDIFRLRRAPIDPTLYLCITSKTDPEHAPAGHENWFVMVNAPYLDGRYNWAIEEARYRRHIIGLLAANIDRISRLSNARDLFVTQRTMTPHNLQTLYGGNRGAIYGYSSNSKTAAFLRPSNRDSRVRGLYHASGSAHPGGGVPLVTLSGRAAAACAHADLIGESDA